MSRIIISKIFSKSFIKQFIKFSIVGGLGTLVNLGVLYLFTELFLVYYIVSEIIAFIISGLHNFLIDKIWTFKEKIEDQIVIKYFQFIIISSTALIVNLILLFVLVEYFHFWYIISEIGAIICAFIINFIGNKYWTFRIKAKNS